MYADDYFRVPAPADPIRKAHSKIPGRPNFRRGAELGERVRAGDPATGTWRANETLSLLLERVASVSPHVARPKIRASAASNRLVNTNGESPGAGRTGVYRPHINMPETGTPILKSELLATPLADGSSNTVNSYRVPRGQTLVIREIWNLYTGPGFVQGGNPQMLFRILRDGQPFKGFEAFRFLYGSSAGFFELAGQLLAYPEQTVEMVVIHEAGSILPVPGTSVIMAFDGWEYPS